MKYPKYGAWCKETVIETIRKHRIYEEKEYLEDFIFNPNSDLYSSGVYDYEVDALLWTITGYDSDDLSKTLFSAVQHGFEEKYFQIAQKMNPEIDMMDIRRNGDGYTDLLFRTLDGIPINEIKDAVMYALNYGTEEVEGAKIPYVDTFTGNIDRVINNNLVQIQKVYISYLNPEVEQKSIRINDFLGYLMHLSQSGIFADLIKWRYVDLFDSGKFLIEGDINHNNGYELNVAIVTKDGEDKDKVVKILKGSEE